MPTIFYGIISISKQNNTPEDALQRRKRGTYCTSTFQKLWDSCSDKIDWSSYAPGQPLKDCLEANATVEELLDFRETMELYGRWGTLLSFEK